MERRSLLKAAATAALLPGGIAGLIGEALANGRFPIQAGLRRFTGQVSVNGQTATQGMLIKPGDTVTTGRRSEAIYVIGEDAFLQRADTSINFGVDAADFFRVVTGSLLSVFGRGRKQLRVPTATIGIRGTACYIEAEESRTYFCLCYGEAEVVPTAAPQQEEVIRTRHHDHPIYIHGDPAMVKSMVSAEVKNHTDDELMLLEEVVGRWPPFYSPWNAWRRY